MLAALTAFLAPYREGRLAMSLFASLFPGIGRPERRSCRARAACRLSRRDRMAQLRAADARGAPRTRRRGAVLDVHVRQLAENAAVRA